MNRWHLILSLLGILSNCHSNNSITPVYGQGLSGKWLLVEQGYSPGAGYIIDKIPAASQQILVFTDDRRVQAQGDKLRSYQFYTQFRLDTTNQVVLIHFSPSINGYSEQVSLSNSTLKLYPPCVEGCHLGFIRIK
ncbi:hypothetical protein [Spirosoma litoris]